MINDNAEIENAEENCLVLFLFFKGYLMRRWKQEWELWNVSNMTWYNRLMYSMKNQVIYIEN